jgi:hypothetical protein
MYTKPNYSSFPSSTRWLTYENQLIELHTSPKHGHHAYQSLKQAFGYSLVQHVVCNGTKTLGTGPIKWSILINEGDVGAAL